MAVELRRASVADADAVRGTRLHLVATDGPANGEFPVYGIELRFGAMCATS